MPGRKTRRGNVNNKEENINISKSAKKQIIIMFVSIFLMIFSVVQVFYLAKYTLGYDVPQEKIKIYRWVQLLVDDNSK